MVDCSYVDIEVNDVAIRIAGYMPYYRQPGMYPVDEAQRQLELDFADGFENTDRLKILLNHIPTQWVDWDYIALMLAFLLQTLKDFLGDKSDLCVVFWAWF